MIQTSRGSGLPGAQGGEGSTLQGPPSGDTRHAPLRGGREGPSTTWTTAGGLGGRRGSDCSPGRVCGVASVALGWPSGGPELLVSSLPLSGRHCGSLAWLGSSDPLSPSGPTATSSVPSLSCAQTGLTMT